MRIVECDSNHAYASVERNASEIHPIADRESACVDAERVARTGDGRGPAAAGVGRFVGERDVRGLGNRQVVVSDIDGRIDGCFGNLIGYIELRFAVAIRRARVGAEDY